MEPDESSRTPQPSSSTRERDGLNERGLFGLGLPSTAVNARKRGAWVPPQPEELAELLPQYRINALIGRGGMGAVYRGVQPALDRAVAIKLLPAEFADEVDFMVCFHREARLLAKLQHPGIVTIYDFGQTREGHFYFAMELVDGTDLHHIIRAGDLSPDQALELIGQVCDALQYAHDQGVVHRDIKPGNILVAKDGRAKLADFGLARPSAEQSAILTSSPIAMGTPAYMAPEQREGHADHRSDIYALGMLFYEMLTGRRAEGAFELPSVKAKVDRRLDQVVLRALQQEPDRRYQNASEMKAKVEAIRHTLGATQGISSARSKARGWTAAGFLFLLTMAAGWIWFQGARSVDKNSLAPGVGAPAVNAIPIPKATESAPFVNSLGMKFVPVPINGGPTSGMRVLFSIWETRVQDYEAFQAASAVQERRIWPKPDFEQGATHPAVNVSWEDATAFCAWLTRQEREAGQLGMDEIYRLPTDHEWSCAVGIGDREDAAASPASKDKGIAEVFPWGGTWPPPASVGNYWSEELRPLLNGGRFAFGTGELAGRHDAYATTSPVGSYAPGPHGLFDLGGNAWEWCQDRYAPNQSERVLRGASWNTDERSNLLSSMRNRRLPNYGRPGCGFRCVLGPPVPAARGS